MCDDLNDGNAHVDVCDGDIKYEMRAATLLRDDVAKGRAEDMAWYDKFDAYEEVTDKKCLSRTGCKAIP